MASYKVKEVKGKAVWEKFVLGQEDSSFLQSWNWGETNRQVGEKIFRLGVFEGKKLVGVGLIIKTRAKRGDHFLIPGGPLINWKKPSQVSAFFDYVKDLARKEKVWFIRCRPQLRESPKSRKIFKSLGFRSAPMHLHAETTWVLDITPGEEELLMGMRKTTRYLVRRSQKENLSIEMSQDPKDAAILYNLQEETVKRHGFVGFPKELFAAQLKTFGKEDQASLFIGRHKKEVLAASIFIFYGQTAYYHHSASTLKYPKIPASYFMQWEVIKEAKKRGCKTYNLWGISPVDNPRHRFWGVTLFKMGFGGERVDFLHAQDFPVSPTYWATYAFETLRRVRRRL